GILNNAKTHASTPSSWCYAHGCTPNAQRVQFILGEDVDDGSHEPHPLFAEMGELVHDGNEMEWKETARWSKPHVATLTLHSLFELRSMLLNGTVMLDMEASSLEQVADLVLDNMVNSGFLPFDCRDKVIHKHEHPNDSSTT
ncbi:Sodium bicarbonate cotransporter 3, partial [Blattella germanica]